MVSPVCGYTVNEFAPLFDMNTNAPVSALGNFTPDPLGVVFTEVITATNCVALPAEVPAATTLFCPSPQMATVDRPDMPLPSTRLGSVTRPPETPK